MTNGWIARPAFHARKQIADLISYPNQRKPIIDNISEL